MCPGKLWRQSPALWDFFPPVIYNQHYFVFIEIDFICVGSLSGYVLVLSENTLRVFC